MSEQSSLEEILALTKETHEKVANLHRALQWGRGWAWIKTIFWMVVLVASAYYSLPYLKMLQQITGGASTGGVNMLDFLKNPSGAGSQLQEFQNLFSGGKTPTRAEAMKLLQSGPFRGMLNDPEIQKVLNQLPRS